MSASSIPTCAVIHGQETYEGKQGLTYFAGISAQSVGAQAICLQRLSIPSGGRAKAHLHEHHETAMYLLSGQAELWYGEGLSDYLSADAGDYVYIPAGVPHVPGNRSQTEPCLAVIARADPNEQESVVPLPDLDLVLLQRPQAPKPEARKPCFCSAYPSDHLVSGK
jgi:uncharacterized RmlC-like cupin family protein